MGRYADPQMIVDKRFEKAQAQLDKMYTNVAQNIGQIAARKKKKKQALADKYSNAAGRYLKETATFRKESNEFAQTRNMNAEKKQAFSDNLASKYNEGYVNIQNYIKQGNHTDAEIQEFVNKQINLAGSLSKKILTLEGMAADWSEAVNASGKSEGKNTGSAVVGSAYSDILSTMTETDNIDGKIQWDKMGLVGSLDPSIDANGNPVPEDKRVGFNIFFDNNLGEDAQEGIADPGEILNLDAAEKNFTKGKKEYYYQTVKDDKDIYTTTFKSSLKATNKTKKGNFMTTVTYVDENGATQQKNVVDKTKRQDYFLTGDGQDLLNSVVDGNEVMLIQKYFGAQAAAKLDDPPKEQDIVKLKVKMLERLDPDFDDGDQKLIMNKSTKSNQFTKNTNHEVVRGFYEDTHAKTAKFVTAGDTNDAVKEYNRYLQDRPYSFGGKVYTIDRMNIIDGLKVELISKSGVKLQQSSYFDLTTDEGRKKLEEGLMKGNFQGTSDQKHVDGYMQAAYTTEQGKTFGTGDLDAYQGAQSTTTRISNSGIEGTISYDEYKKLEADKKDKLTSTTMEWSWEENEEASTSFYNLFDPDTAPQANQLGVVEEGEAGDIFVQDVQAAQETGGVFGSDASGNFKMNAPDGTSLSFNSNQAASPIMKEKDDNKNALRRIGNFEAFAGSPGATGLANYGMKDAKYLDAIKDAGLKPNTEEGFLYALEYVAKPAVFEELGIKSVDDMAAFDKMDEVTQASLIDWEYNTGRDVGDLVHIAQMMKDDSWKKKVDLGDMTLTQLVNASGSRKVNIKVGDKTYKTAAEAMKALKADDSPVKVNLPSLTPDEIAKAKHSIMGDKTSRSESDIDTYNKTWKYRIDQLK